MNLDFCVKTKIAATGLDKKNSIEDILQQKYYGYLYLFI